MKAFQYRGKSIEELKKMDLADFVKLLPSRQRRSVKRGFNPIQKRLLEKVKKTNEGVYKKSLRTHCRDLLVLPEMVDLKISIYNGKDWVQVMIIPEMIGHYLGELSMTRKKVMHSAPGIGATKSSTAASSKAK